MILECPFKQYGCAVCDILFSADVVPCLTNLSPLFLKESITRDRLDLHLQDKAGKHSVLLLSHIQTLNARISHLTSEVDALKQAKS